MNRQGDISTRLKDLSKALGGSGALADEVMRRIETEGVSVSRRYRRRRRWVMTSMIGVAAGGLAALSFWSIFLGTPGTLYAETMAALKNVHTLHVAMKDYHDGHLLEERDWWYKKGQVFVEHHKIGDEVYVKIEDANQAWWFSPQGNMVARMKSYRSIEDAVCLDAVISPTRLLKGDLTRDPSGDKVVDGQRWELYVKSGKGNPKRIWTDRSKRVRALSYPFGRLRREHIYEYDVAVDSALCKPKRGPDVKVIEPRAYCEAEFALDKAMAKAETENMVFAVHTLERLDDRWCLLVTSTRLSREMARKTGVVRPFPYNIGEARFYISTSAETPTDCPYLDPWQLGDMKIGDLTVDWWLVRMKGRPLREGEKFSQLVHVTGAVWSEEQQTLGGALIGIAPLEITLPAPGPPSGRSVEQALADLYDRSRRLRPLMDSFNLLGLARESENSKRKLQSWDPRQVTKEQFIENVKSRIESPDPLARGRCVITYGRFPSTLLRRSRQPEPRPGESGTSLPSPK